MGFGIICRFEIILVIPDSAIFFNLLAKNGVRIEFFFVCIDTVKKGTEAFHADITCIIEEKIDLNTAKSLNYSYF